MSYLNPYSLFIDLKNYLYDQKAFEQIQINPKVKTKIISIGNLNTGGSGKTPFIQFLAESFKDKKILIICKSYKAKLMKPSRVDLANLNAAAVFGDEACLLQQLLPECDVWSGPSKSQTALAATSGTKIYDIILIDDGFSHRRLFRHCDIVLVDASRTASHYRLFPLGHMRENWKTLRRSNLVILTKTEGLTPDQKKYFYQQINPYQKNLIESQFQSVLESDNKKIFLVTGIGHPEKLKTDLIKQGYSVDKYKFYSDHFAFPESEQNLILDEAKKNSELQLVMTAKDLIKIKNQQLIQKIKIVNLKIQFSQNDRKILNETVLS